MPLDSRVAVEVRGKAIPTRALIEFAVLAREVAVSRGAALIVNDRVDVALATRADGVHLPANGLPVSVSRSLCGDARFVGCSIHAPGESRMEGADFFRFGPVFATPSKAAFGPPQGIDGLRDAVICAGKRSVFGVGGIDIGRIAAVREAGAHGVAVIRDWLTARDPARWLVDALLALSGRA